MKHLESKFNLEYLKLSTLKRWYNFIVSYSKSGCTKTKQRNELNSLISCSISWCIFLLNRTGNGKNSSNSGIGLRLKVSLYNNKNSKTILVIYYVVY